MTASPRTYRLNVRCACCTPALEAACRRLEGVTRRHVLAGAAASVAGAAVPALAQTQASAPDTKILFSRIRLFDGTSDMLRSGVQVLVQGTKIVAVDTTNSPPPPGSIVVDGGDRVLMPGLIDAHWHTLFAAVPLSVLVSGDPGFIFAAATAEAERTVLRGFTTVRDMGGPVFSFKQAIDQRVIAGPRIFPCGAMITTSGGHGDLRMLSDLPRTSGQLSTIERLGGAMLADSAGELQLRVREQLLQGASQVKLVGGGGVSSPRSPLDMSTFSEDELRAAVRVAQDWNTYAAVHAFAPKTIQRAVAAGAACVEHGHLMDEDTARLIADKGVWLSTQPFLTLEDVGSPPGPSGIKAQQVIARTPDLYRMARQHGIKLAWGSDLLFSPELARRQGTILSHLSQWYTNGEALRMATSGNAELLALSGERYPYPGRLGVVQAGALADLLLVNGNPLDDLGLIEEPTNGLALIMKDGRILKTMLPPSAADREGKPR